MGGITAHKNMKKISFIFPGQGAQYSKMGLDFYTQFQEAKECFQEADDILNRPLSKIIFEGSDQELTATKNSQPAIFVTSYAILKVLQKQFPEIAPSYAAGLSLGEYTALTAAHVLHYKDALTLVQARGQFMHDCCEKHAGTMAVVLGLDDETAERCVQEVNMPHELWAANFNCPGQVVISGTKKGIEIGSQALLAKGAKKVMPLQVHGAFHSGLMQEAQDKLTEVISETSFHTTDIRVAMNVTGGFVTDTSTMKQLLIQQVTHPVRWSRAVKAIDQDGATLFLEIGCGKTLSGMNKRIPGLTAETCNIDKIEDLHTLESKLRG